MKVVKSYTDREIRIILEAIVEDAVRTHDLVRILRESKDKKTGGIEVTERGERTIEQVLGSIASVITIELPVIGWILGPLLGFLTFTGASTSYVVRLIEDNMDINQLVKKVEDKAVDICLTANIPIVGRIVPIAGKVADRVLKILEPDADPGGGRGADARLTTLLFRKSVMKNQAVRESIEKHMKYLMNKGVTVNQAASIIYAIDLMLDILTAAHMSKGKTVKKKQGKKKGIKIPGGKEGFIKINDDLKPPYSYLKGVDPDDSLEQDIDRKVKSAMEDEPDDGIIDVDVEEVLFDNEDEINVSGVPYKMRTRELPPPDDFDLEDEQRLLGTDEFLRGLQDDQIERYGDDFEIDSEEQTDPDDFDLDEMRYVKNLKEQIEVIKIINRVLR